MEGEEMKHVGCGGVVVEDWSQPYRFTGVEAKEFGAVVPRYLCQKCGEEILGDVEIELEGVTW